MVGAVQSRKAVTGKKSNSRMSAMNVVAQTDFCKNYYRCLLTRSAVNSTILLDVFAFLTSSGSFGSAPFIAICHTFVFCALFQELLGQPSASSI